MFKNYFVSILAVLSFVGAASANKLPNSITSGAAKLSLMPSASGGYSVLLEASGKDHRLCRYIQEKPLALEIVDDQGTALWQTEGYQKVSSAAGGFVCTGTVSTPNGSQFRVTDTYASLPSLGAFTLDRQVEIDAAGQRDKGFSSRFSLSPDAPESMANYDFFAPGIWYKDNAHVPPTALASHLSDQTMLFREDRLPLPLIMQRDKRSGMTLVLAHEGGVPETFVGEDGLDRLIDARIQFGSLGVLNQGSPQPVFQFPGTEGERTYTYGGSLNGNRWAYRSHPVLRGIAHHYRLLILLQDTPDFPGAVRESWRTVYARQNPPIIPVDLTKVYRDSISLLAAYIHPYQGAISVPFASSVSDGKVTDTSSQMGFVGQALPAAFLLLQDSVKTKNAAQAAQATAVVDFWAQNSLTPSGMPKTWYDIHPDGAVTWRQYHTFLRVASDGVDGALQAWNCLHHQGQEKPEWLTFCRRYGDWLVGAQNVDGSYYREYDFDGKVAAEPTDKRSGSPRSTDTTDHPIRFLVELYKATGDVRYRAAAQRAGTFCLSSVHDAYAYVGGTPDNPNVLDKEAGMMALDAFLALYDLSQDKRWLRAAIQAADYSETWVYAWNIPMPSGDPKLVFPHNRRTEGLSLIATGHSGADSYMAAAPFFLYRLFLLTGDAHYRTAAQFLLFDTKQMLDWDGTLGYAYPGLQTEALSLPPLRGHGQRFWLPWLTVAQIEPLVRLRDVFGSFDIDAIEKRPKPQRLHCEKTFSLSRGFDMLPVLSMPKEN